MKWKLKSGNQDYLREVATLPFFGFAPNSHRDLEEELFCIDRKTKTLFASPEKYRSMYL
jgi:hypothetical protein